MEGPRSTREKIIKTLGKMPEGAALDPVFSGMEKRDGYFIGTVSYQVEKDERVAAYLLYPENFRQGKNPGIVASHQHAGEYYVGKSEPAGLSSNTMYHYGKDLCKRGYVVICPDHLCFEDRRPPEYRRMENKVLDGENYERFMFCKLILEGSTLQAKYLHDLVCAVGILSGMEEVDPGRIGAIGHSLGGQETAWLAFYDSRIKAAVCSCGISRLSAILRDRINHNFAMFTPGMLEAGDLPALVSEICPRRFMMTNGANDAIFPRDGTEAIASAAKESYEKAGYGENFKAQLFEGGHSFPDEIKKAAYDFLDAGLKI
ncbi:dienelactone hydrolase family protein [Leadbettera azotonutricia]|uniref:Dienelactone hydrolase domain-containing protein n=1 Tax=Leadbettera azotonutricia (strain ATCC BAA-888 / DSM 13862 / ZAS-9) TaxID=545695 RepID=F5YC25_LEAAZ|nr:dienelactone hydrolase family protein [Leadbettera azotonutricia]AEF83123.1 hypothetical protein TREAZ_1779 [Leadbettera azotonutricia ZAS-9]